MWSVLWPPIPRPSVHDRRRRNPQESGAWKVPSIGHIVVADPEFTGVDLDNEGIVRSAWFTFRHVQRRRPSFAIVTGKCEVQFRASFGRTIPHQRDAAIRQSREMSGRGGGVDGSSRGIGPRLSTVFRKRFPEVKRAPQRYRARELRNGAKSNFLPMFSI